VIVTDFDSFQVDNVKRGPTDETRGCGFFGGHHSVESSQQWNQQTKAHTVPVSPQTPDGQLQRAV
jgi:hypothetical protein